MNKLIISTPSGKSVIYCGKGSFCERTERLKGKSLFIVTDKNVYGIYKELLQSTFKDAPVYVIPAGEKSKNYNQLLKILQFLLKNNATRSSTVVAFGGGVVGDIAGLASALYMRGTRLVQIPTTLLAQVDSSVGGKTAVDLNAVKNVIGTFYQPEEVIADPMFLNTLPRREIRCGLGEIIKYGALDADIYGKLTKNESNLFEVSFLENIIFDCIKYKASVVSEDEYDVAGVRKALNLGHTTAHAFELCYKRKSHGEFVLIGMYYETYIAKSKGICSVEYAERLFDLIGKVINIIPAYDNVEEVAVGAAYDKKNESASVISVVVPEREGKSRELRLPLNEYVGLIVECRDGLKGQKC